MKKSEDPLRDLWGTTKWTNVRIMGDSEREERERGKKLVERNNG